VKNKYLPYILVSLALVFGFILKEYSGLSNTDNKVASTNTYSNRIDNRFETLLIYPKKNKLEDFILIDQDSNQFTNANLENAWNLFFIGYTNCPDVCPNTLNELVQLYNSFDSETQEKIRIVFLAVDPARDTPKHLKLYLDFFNEDFIGISGDKNQIDPLVKKLGGIYVINSSEGEFYTVDHSARIFIVDPKVQRFGIIAGQSLSKNREQLSKDLAELVSKF